MSIRLLAASLALAGASIAWATTDEPIKPIPAAKVSNPAAVELGKKLFFDPRLSKSGFISCNSCHNLSMGGTDNLKTSIGHNWNEGPINAPTVLNSSLNLAQFWDGRAKDLQAQAGGPIANPGEMASNHALAVEVLQSIPGYVAEFKKAFGSDKVTIEEVTKPSRRCTMRACRRRFSGSASISSATRRTSSRPISPGKCRNGPRW